MATEIHTLRAINTRSTRDGSCRRLCSHLEGPAAFVAAMEKCCVITQGARETRGRLSFLCICARGTSTTRFARTVWTPNLTSHPRTGRPTSRPLRPGRSSLRLARPRPRAEAGPREEKGASVVRDGDPGARRRGDGVSDGRGASRRVGRGSGTTAVDAMKHPQRVDSKRLEGG